MQRPLRFLTAAQAAQALSVTKATLYAYASRGQLRSEPLSPRSRKSRYFAEEVERLRERKEVRRDPAKAAARGLHWGSPVLDSRLTLIYEGRLYYRGKNAVELAATASLEQVADLLWAANREPLFDQSGALSKSELRGLRACVRDPMALLQAALPAAGAADWAAHDLRPAAVRRAGARILRLLATLASGSPANGPIHLALQRAWAPRSAAAGEAIRKALVLCADHELNVSTFAARCAASAAATPYDTVSAALATLKGRRHGSASERVSALFAEVRAPQRARAVLAGRLRSGEDISGFGHPLYPDGDPRAAVLLELAAGSGNTAEWRLVQAVQKAASTLLHEQPNLDFGLVALARTFVLPGHAPLILFALGRAVGWIAHAIEQYESSELIRPRARYTGVLPNVIS
jgi:citrate synthase